ncbi:hypothetical protein, partial [Bacillus cereus]|uniref:hypothetical protein n=1 Tax=Bacillus cereus TaxID=1396 RepID=UPI001E5762E4
WSCADIFQKSLIYLELRRYISKIADIFEVAIDMFNEEKAKGDVTADISFFSGVAIIAQTSQ